MHSRDNIKEQQKDLLWFHLLLHELSNKSTLKKNIKIYPNKISTLLVFTSQRFLFVIIFLSWAIYVLCYSIALIAKKIKLNKKSYYLMKFLSFFFFRFLFLFSFIFLIIHFAIYSILPNNNISCVTVMLKCLLATQKIK